MNKKIVNTNPKSYNGIDFKSTFEVSCYKKLESSGLEFQYEPEKVVLWTGIKPSCDVYLPKQKSGKYSKELYCNDTKMVNITYTPDFKVTAEGIVAYFDVKGFPNDRYPLKRKMFIKYLSELNDGNSYMFFEPHTVGHMNQAIELIKQLIDERKETTAH